MSESVHAVVSNRQKSSSISHDEDSKNPKDDQEAQKNTKESVNQLSPNTVNDDDDDIDIIMSSISNSGNFLSSGINVNQRPQYVPSEPQVSSYTLNYRPMTPNNIMFVPSLGTYTNQLPAESNTIRSHPDSSNNQDSEWVVTPDLTQTRNKLRRNLRYHFMSPIDKWKIKGRFPWKMLFQIVKIILVTTQVILFGNNFTSFRSVDNSMLMTLHDLFLLQWDSSREYTIVPPNVGPYAVYTKSDLYSHIDFAIQNYANITKLSFGSFGYQPKQESKLESPFGDNLISLPKKVSSITACFQHYANATLNPSLGVYFIDPNVEERCVVIDNLYPPGSPKWKDFSFYQFLLQNTPELTDFQSFIHLSLKFPLRVMLLTTLSSYNVPQCYDLDLVVHFNNKPHSGEISISMVLNKNVFECTGNLKPYAREAQIHNLIITINIIVLLLCATSLVLCIRTLLNAQKLRKETDRFFMVAYKRHLDYQSSLHFIDGWILMILVNDILLIIGTIINILRRFNMIGPQKTSSLHPFQLDSLCSAFLGVGLLLVWLGILRYLAFFDQYNILLVTIKHSLSRVLRFALCVLVLYGGFCFSGWIILGPFHFKFQTLARTSECLFALMNGDDVFATFAYLEYSSPFVWWFSRIYLYSYVLLFIYVVLSLFIAILMDSYETIKEYYNSSRQRKIRIDFLWSNDQLSRFLMATFDNDDNSDSVSSYRINLMNDASHEQRQQQTFDNENQCCCHCFYSRLQLSSWFNHCFNNIRNFIIRRDQHQHESVSIDGENEPLNQMVNN